jgi:thioredoxin-dependent peroxiredoxin
VLAAAVAACASGGHATLTSGARVPDVGGRDQTGAFVRLTRYHGRPLVIYFYPKDRTSGCTLEAQGFRAEYPRFRALGAEVVGVSNDDVDSHQDFCAKEGLPFPLLADRDESVAHAFGVPTNLGFYHRMTFLVDASGLVRRVWDPVNPTGHARAVLAAVQALAAGTSGATSDGGGP